MLYDLSCVHLSLRPRKFNQIPAWQGRAAQALFYEALHDIHPMVSETIHDLYKWQPIMPKPFTMSNLIGVERRADLMLLKPTQLIELHLTTLHPHLTGIVEYGVLPLWLRRGITIHDQYMKIAKITRHSRIQYSDILAQAGDDKQMTLCFTSPTAFKRTGKGLYGKPDARLIFLSLLNRWNAFAIAPLPNTLKTAIESQLTITHARTSQRKLHFKRGQKGTVWGFYGEVQIALDVTSSELRQMLNALADFARYSGAGIRTTVGMGQVSRG